MRSAGVKTGRFSCCMLQNVAIELQRLTYGVGSSTQHVCNMKRPKTPLSAIETTRIIARLFDLYRQDRSPDRDRSRDGDRYAIVLNCAVRDGLLRLPPKSGAPSKWKGKLGFDLVEAVEAIQAANWKKVRKPGRQPTIKLMSVPQAIGKLRDRYPDEWGVYLSDDLEKRYYEAKKVWDLNTRIRVSLDRWHERRPEIYPEKS